ncbi:queuosine salvage family protein [Conexibacter sp. CPCC 206217]|uniref:queuosine salvage family protein n=1 Tax=Conexibacter sp. CPCC 206217 TaxID=3064574 RepID=UPI0027173A5A|nr:queuosine salvage family protein [Conexibacter sp. CPCC 206217]MDO8211870.1 queuosine salvage family protein [Conexibacter sp. CPCC 206217]
MPLVDDIRDGAAWVAAQATHVVVDRDAIDAYAAAFASRGELPGIDADAHVVDGPAELRAAFFLTLDAINFGSGWFPTIRKRAGRSGYFTVALGLRDRFRAHGAWSAAELSELSTAEIAGVLGQDPQHELMALFARSLNDLGARITSDHDGRFLGPVEASGASAVALVEELATWNCFRDVSPYGGRTIPLFKRAQVAASDLALVGAAAFGDLERLTLFADNLIPHVLRLDGILRFEPALVARIEAGELIEHDSPEEVEMRAGAIHVAELIAAARADLTPALVDQTLWTRGGGARYKAVPRPRARSTAY